ncbi:MAG TPA: hypothetical protein VG942_13805 [Hyphomonadaceae bacterium]|nr:hypothetical protein [Hyphomonadaceae bacterium]
MRRILLGVIVVGTLGACGPEGPKRAASENVVADAPNRGAMWPVMLQHCLRSPNCDPMSDFGKGAGQASGLAGYAAYFVETKDVVKEGGVDYGAAITVSVYGSRAGGGKAGRPLTIDEAPDNLHGTDARRSTLSIEYRTPGGGKPEAYTLAIHPAWVAMSVPGLEAAKTQAEISDTTSDFIARLSFGPEMDGAKIELNGKAGVIATFYSIGLPSGDKVKDEDAAKRGFEPWVFYASRNIRDEPLPTLMKALAEGESLNLKITVPTGDAILYDTLYVDGFAKALKEGEAALTDPAIGQPIQDRCEGFDSKPRDFWKTAAVTPALHTCDARTQLQRQQDAAPPQRP